jgi:hypothetical protein
MSSPVVTGVRDASSIINRNSPTESELPRAFEHARTTLLALPPKAGEVVFVSNSRHYLFQLTNPRHQVDPATGLDASEPPRVARFDSYLFRTSDEWTIKRMKSDRFFNIDFWDASEKIAAETEALNQALLNRIKERSTPEQVAKLIADLKPLAQVEGQKGFNLPKRETNDGAKAKANT